jgi:ParB-like chromosome segregation protein Spo0J
MNESVRMSFEPRLVNLALRSIVPCKKLPDGLKNTKEFKSIAKSIAEIGIVEPLVVSRTEGGVDQFLLLDGHVRYAALQDLGATETVCLIASDDEAFTYNRRVSRLSTVQAHYMLKRALENGVSEKKLANALNIDLRQLKRRRTLLNGICPEVVELFSDKTVSPHAFDALKKMKPARQIEAAELMVSISNWSGSYAKALLAGTKQGDLARPERAKKLAGVTTQQMARMEREMSSLHEEFSRLEASYGDDVLHLVIASRYVATLLGNPAVEQYLQEHHFEMLQEFRAIVAATSLEDPRGLAA